MLKFNMSNKSNDTQTKIINPFELTREHLVTIRKLARVVMDTHKCDYTQAVVIAYFEWIEMANMDKTRH